MLGIFSILSGYQAFSAWFLETRISHLTSSTSNLSSSLGSLIDASSTRVYCLSHLWIPYIFFDTLVTYLELRLPFSCASSSSSDNFLMLDPLPRPLPRPTPLPLGFTVGNLSPLSISVSSRTTGFGRRPAPGRRPPRLDLGLTSFNSSSSSCWWLLDVASSEVC